MNFCNRAGAFSTVRRADLASELNKHLKFHSAGLRVDDRTGEKVLTIFKDFIRVEWKYKLANNKNLKNHNKNQFIDNIIIYMKLDHLSLIIEKTASR